MQSRPIQEVTLGLSQKKKRGFPNTSHLFLGVAMMCLASPGEISKLETKAPAAVSSTKRESTPSVQLAHPHTQLLAAYRLAHFPFSLWFPTLTA